MKIGRSLAEQKLYDSVPAKTIGQQCDWGLRCSGMEQ